MKESHQNSLYCPITFFTPQTHTVSPHPQATPPQQQPAASTAPYPPQQPQPGNYYLNYSNNDFGLISAAITATEEAAALREREKHRDEAEQARQKVFTSYDESTYIQSRSGKLMLLMPFQITDCVLVKPDIRTGIRPFYTIEFNAGRTDKLELFPRQFENDKSLLDAIQGATQQKVNFVGSRTRTAYLVRQAAMLHFREVSLPFYGGWSNIEGSWKFLQFSGFTSHMQTELEDWQFLDESTARPAFAASAAASFCRRFRNVLNPHLRGTLFLWSHVSFLSSLLSALGFAPKLALGLCCDSQRAITLCSDLLSLYGDGMTSLGMIKSAFAEHLLRAKDQSVLLLDERKGCSAENVRLLQDAITAGAFCVPRLGEVPFQATVTVFSREASDLVCSSNCFTLEVGAEAVSREEYSLDEDDEIAADHFSAFAHFVGEHIRELRTDLTQGQNHADQLSEEYILSPAAQQTLASMLGVCDFLKRFYGQQHIRVDLESIIPEDFQEFFLQTLEESSDRADSDDLSRLFLEVARKMVVNGKLKELRREEIQANSVRGILLHDEWAFVTTKAVDDICANMASSRPAVVRALKESGLLHGKTVNQETNLTRVSISGPDGKQITLRGLKLRRDEFGSSAPLFLRRWKDEPLAFTWCSGAGPASDLVQRRQPPHVYFREQRDGEKLLSPQVDRPASLAGRPLCHF